MIHSWSSVFRQQNAHAYPRLLDRQVIEGIPITKQPFFERPESKECGSDYVQNDKKEDHFYHDNLKRIVHLDM